MLSNIIPGTLLLLLRCAIQIQGLMLMMQPA